MVSVHRADEAVRDLLDLRITRYPHLVLLPRIWQFRHNFSASDAAYIVLAEKLGAALVTRGARLASASGHANGRSSVRTMDRMQKNMESMGPGMIHGHGMGGPPPTPSTEKKPE